MCRDGSLNRHEILAFLEDPDFTRLKPEVNQDPQYQQLLTATQHGFPSDKRRLDDTPGPFLAICHDLWTANGIVMHGSRGVSDTTPATGPPRAVLLP